MVLPGALTNYLSLVEYRKLNKAPKRENRKLHKRTHPATTRIVNLLSYTAQLAHNSVDLSKWRALPGKLGGNGGAVQQAKGSREVRWRVGHTGHTNTTKRASSTLCAHVWCAPEHTSARCAHVCSFQGITTHWKPVVPLRSVDVRVLRPVYLLCSNTSADISYKSTLF